MGTARQVPSAVVVGGKLYAIGGADTDLTSADHAFIGLNSVEAFDPQTGTWAEVTPMRTARSSPGAAVLDGKIYVSGGDTNAADTSDAFANTVEVYDPQTNTWGTAAPMVMARNSHCMAELGGQIYAVGGLDNGISRLSSAEAFDPQTNTWTPVASMSTERSQFSLTAVRGKLFAVGGWSGGIADGGATTVVEAYDPQQDRWECVAHLPEDRYEHCAVVM